MFGTPPEPAVLGSKCPGYDGPVAMIVGPRASKSSTLESKGSPRPSTQIFRVRIIGSIYIGVK
ncbi:hypothetical protein BC828DRAFT_390659 [Blastocladiella britannica]|nr:hypothetical protein BC828DRAFT_390659 [Blastocladiella britannica]